MGEELALPVVEYAGSQASAVRRILWMRIGLIALLLVGLFWPNLRRLWLKTNPFFGEANWQHSIFVPLIGLYYLYLNRDVLLDGGKAKPPDYRLLALGLWAEVQAVLIGVLFFVLALLPTALEGSLRKSMLLAALATQAALFFWYTVYCFSLRGRGATAIRTRVTRWAQNSAGWFGSYVMIWGILFYAWSIWPGQNDFFKDGAMVVTIFGVVLLLGGWSVMRTAWFPIIFLVCAIPWPELVYSWVALPLQQLAAQVAAYALKGTGVDATCVGTKLRIAAYGGLPPRDLNVAEACAGLRSLMTFISVGAAVAFLSNRQLWQKLVISVSAVPIAIFCNVMRVAGQGLLDHYVSQSLSESFAHQFVGLIMLIPAFFLILLVGWILDNLFIEDIEHHGLEVRRQAATEDSQLIIEIPRAGRARTATAQLPGGPSVAVADAKPAEGGAETPAANDLAAATLRLTSARGRKQAADRRPS